MQEFKSLVVIPEAGTLIINGNSKEKVSSLCLEFINGKWVLSFDETKTYEATAPGWN